MISASRPKRSPKTCPATVAAMADAPRLEGRDDAEAEGAGQLIFPLRDYRSVNIEMDYTEETATEYRKQLCSQADVDVILLEGIYLLKRAFQTYYDLSFWIDCTFDTALERAIARGQEGLLPEATISAYRTIYFPAQKIHFTRDNPKGAATAIIPNDPRLSNR